MKRFILALCMFAWGQAYAVLQIEITEGAENALPIAIVPFHDRGLNCQSGTVCANELLTQIVNQDLLRSGRFKVTPRTQLVATPSNAQAIRFAQWKNSNVENLVLGQVQRLANGQYQVDVRLFDVLRQKQVEGQRWVVDQTRLRELAHKISDLIYEKLLGVQGVFSTKVAYITVNKEQDKKKYVLEVSDSDGFNPQPILTSLDPLLSPSWSPDGRQIAYVSFEQQKSEVYLQSVETGQREKIASFKGLNGAPAWSPDGRKLALTLSRDGNAEIYVMDIATRKLERITRHWAIDTEPTWMPDGRSLLFTSDRSGQPQIYEKVLGENGVKRLTFTGKYNAHSSVSPDGKKIAVVHGAEGNFHIALLEKDTGDMFIVSDTFLDESPTFSANGDMIIYATTYRNRGVLSVLSVDGKVSQRLSGPSGDVREPAWGPILE